jgi:hypothetical protein
MPREEHEGAVSITRTSNEEMVEGRTIEIRVRVGHHRKFAVVRMTPHDFAMALTGLSEVPATVQTNAIAPKEMPS